MECTPSNRTLGWGGYLLGDELTWRGHAQAGVWVDGVVVVELGRELLEHREGIRTWVHADVVALERLHKRFADAIALRASDWRETRHQAEGGSESGGCGGGGGGGGAGGG